MVTIRKYNLSAAGIKGPESALTLSFPVALDSWTTSFLVEQKSKSFLSTLTNFIYLQTCMPSFRNFFYKIFWSIASTNTISIVLQTLV
jgi:hypothetical protein